MSHSPRTEYSKPFFHPRVTWKPIWLFSVTHEKLNWIAKASFKPVMIILSFIKDTKASYKFQKCNRVHYILGLFFAINRPTFLLFTKNHHLWAIFHTKLWLQKNLEFWWKVRIYLTVDLNVAMLGNILPYFSHLHGFILKWLGFDCKQITKQC